jgi:hypothetical protein
MWPCVIKKFIKDARGNFKVHVNYYEANDKKSNVFKFDPSKIELFFRPDAEKHFEYKVSEMNFFNLNQIIAFFQIYLLSE